MSAQQIEILKQIGSEWQKGDKHRIYFNNLSEIYGLNCEYYNSGNICGADLNGERISNGQAKKLIGKLLSCKVWYDLVDGKFWHTAPQGDTAAADMCKVIKSKIKQFVTEKEAELQVA